MATATLTELNQNVSAICRIADVEDVVITRYDKPVYRLSRIRLDDPVEYLISTGELTPPVDGWADDGEALGVGRLEDRRSTEILTDMRSR